MESRLPRNDSTAIATFTASWRGVVTETIVHFVTMTEIRRPGQTTTHTIVPFTTVTVNPEVAEFSTPVAASATPTSSQSSSSAPALGADSTSDSSKLNKTAIIGITFAVTISVVVLILLIYVFLRIRNASRRRNLDREMDDSFQQAMEKVATKDAELYRAQSNNSTMSIGADNYSVAGGIVYLEYASADHWQQQSAESPPDYEASTSTQTGHVQPAGLSLPNPFDKPTELKVANE
ncbi:hypothetical protein R3P38DRAFT_2801307 [Favolaschia claudopus]|uniref:Uncharacterized protein n=1 Tax=Favolaschia claudopus TaxID=2862362 RepID=A0AAV9ZWQ1_9AGAR